MGKANSAILATLLLACGSGPVSLRVDVRTDLTPGVEFDRVELEAADEIAVHEVDPGGDYLAGVRVARLEGLRPGSLRATVTLMNGPTRVLTRPLSVLLERDTAVTVLLTRDCRGVSCPGAAEAALAACLGGRCVDEGCTAEDPTGCAEPECGADADCPAASACAVPRCIAGTCLYGADDTCTPNQYCDPERGCLARPTTGPGAVEVTELEVVWATPRPLSIHA